MSFHVGQLVTPVRDHTPWRIVAGGNVNFHRPVIGRIYTVTGVENEGDDCWLRLAEGSAGTRYCSESFRPLDDTRLSVFREMLAPKPTKVSA